MYQTDEAKIYYLYMLSDGEASKKEKELFTTICKELYIDADEKKRIIKECEKIPSDGIFDEIKELAGDPVEETEKLALMASIRSVLSNLGNRETILWNLINLGYADSKYTYEEREIVDYSDEEKEELQEIVDFLKNHWKVAEDLYQEMIDVAETCLSLEEHRKWVENLEESAYKDEKIKQIKKDIKMAQDNIKLTLEELNF